MITTGLTWNGDKVKKAFAEATTKSQIEAATLVTAEAKSRSPEDLGNLKSSITWTVKGKPSVFERVVGDLGGRSLGAGERIEPEKDEAWVGSIVVYAIYQELGTRTMKAQPYLIPALENNVQRIIAIFKQNGLGIAEVQK